ncbi:MAG TPA: hypothetical protein VGJ84_24500 [Polyangiaceae bacterium]
MSTRLNRAHRAIPAMLGALTLASVGLLLAWDAFPGLFPTRAHDVLAAVPLSLIAVTYLLYQSMRRPAPMELLKAVLLAAAFLLWAANQLWPALPQATLFNDLAIALFVLDVFLVIIGWPRKSPDAAFGETYVEKSSGTRRMARNR